MPASNKIQVGYIEAQDGAQFQVDAGTAAAPGLVFDDSAATGLYSPGTGQIAWSTSGKQTALRILADGKVGVDCSPTVAFEVNGTIKASAIDAPIEGTLDDWIVHAGDTNTKLGFPGADQFEIHANGGPRLRITSAGHVLCGQTGTDNAFFKAYAADGEADDLYVGQFINAEATAGRNYGVNIQAGSNSTDHGFRVKNHAGTVQYIVRGDGKVGINETTPDKLLHLSANNTSVSANAVTSANNTIRFTDTDTTVTSNQPGGTIEWETLDSNAAGVNAYIATKNSNTGYSSMHFGTGNASTLAERLSITQGGNVDINGNPPWTVTGGDWRNLSISGQTASSSGFIWLGNGAAATNADFDLARVNICNGATIVAQIIGTTQTGANDDGRITFSTKATGSALVERLRIDSSGRLGLGNVSPGDYSGGFDDLVIKTSGNTGITVVSGTSSQGTLSFADGTSGDAQYRGYMQYTHSSDTLAFGVGGTGTGGDRAIISKYGMLTLESGSQSGNSKPGIELKSTGYTGNITRLFQDSPNATSVLETTERSLVLDIDSQNQTNGSCIQIDIDGVEEFRFDPGHFEFKNNSNQSKGTLLGGINYYSNTNLYIDLTQWTMGTNWNHLEVFGYVNPNGAGSGQYTDPVHMYIYRGVGWANGGIKNFIYSVHVAPPARQAFPGGSGMSGNSGISAVWCNSGTVVGNETATSTHYVRLVIPNANAGSNFQKTFRILRRF